MPENKVNPAYCSPYPTFFAFLAFLYYLLIIYSSSKDKWANPEPKDPVILSTEFKLPAKVFFNNDPAPFNTPNPPSKGPFTNPSLGFLYKS